jgi:predicted DNA-binding protein (UPF0251 family)
MPIIRIKGDDMARPKRCRLVGCDPATRYFKPRGIPMGDLEDVTVTVDELEAIRLADLDGLYQEEAAEMMNVSRQTFGRIVESAHRKIAEALVNGKALKIEGGEIEMTTLLRKFRCADCEHTWEVPYGTGRPAECPSCKGVNFHRAGGGRGFGGGRRGGFGRRFEQGFGGGRGTRQ